MVGEVGTFTDHRTLDKSLNPLLLLSFNFLLLEDGIELGALTWSLKKEGLVATGGFWSVLKCGSEA